MSEPNEKYCGRCDAPIGADGIYVGDSAVSRGAGSGAPAMCSVCAGTGRPVSGKPCICKGVGTMYAELQGFRERCYELEYGSGAPSEAIRALAEALVPILRVVEKQPTMEDEHDAERPIGIPWGDLKELAIAANRAFLVQAGAIDGLRGAPADGGKENTP